VLGVFAMLYIRDRRLWIWIKPGADGQGSQALLAMSTQRRTLDFDKEFEQMKGRLAGNATVPPSA
jgi:cytochrome c biogenesis protein